jgi:hypothetical protein
MATLQRFQAVIMNSRLRGIIRLNGFANDPNAKKTKEKKEKAPPKPKEKKLPPSFPADLLKVLLRSIHGAKNQEKIIEEFHAQYPHVPKTLIKKEIKCHATKEKDSDGNGTARFVVRHDLQSEHGLGPLVYTPVKQKATKRKASASAPSNDTSHASSVPSVVPGEARPQGMSAHFHSTPDSAVSSSQQSVSGNEEKKRKKKKISPTVPVATAAVATDENAPPTAAPPLEVTSAPPSTTTSDAAAVALPEIQPSQRAVRRIAPTQTRLLFPSPSNDASGR